MMCNCERDIGKHYLPHQLKYGTDLETAERVKVTLGFQPLVCPTCRGMREAPFPRAVTYGRTTKLIRYYWREISHRKIRLLGKWCETQGISDWFKAGFRNRDLLKGFEKQAIEEIKELHAKSPKYDMQEESQSEVIAKYGIETISLRANYDKSVQGPARVELAGEWISVEVFVTKHFEQLGYQTLFLESKPFHALFGVMTWLLIQASDDPKVRIGYFGERSAFEAHNENKIIACPLPEDFGKNGYYPRREREINAHLSLIQSCWSSQSSEKQKREELLWLFDYWVPGSESLRQYLWVHQDEDVARARRLLEILEPERVVLILEFLLRGYWKRYLGWPDLMVFNNNHYFLVEVKSSSDKLSDNQKNWIHLNSNELKIPFKVAKVHRMPQQVGQK